MPQVDLLHKLRLPKYVPDLYRKRVKRTGTVATLPATLFTIILFINYINNVPIFFLSNSLLFG